MSLKSNAVGHHRSAFKNQNEMKTHKKPNRLKYTRVHDASKYSVAKLASGEFLFFCFLFRLGCNINPISYCELQVLKIF